MNAITRTVLQIMVLIAILCVSLTAAFMLLGSRLPTDEIAFDSRRANNFDIYLLDVNHSITFRLTRSAANEYSPAWSPDGEYLAYMYENANDRAIYTMQANGRSPHRLTDVVPLTHDSSLAWSPDGSTLALATVDDSNTQGIFLIGMDGSNLRRVSGSEGSAFMPTWSQDEQIAFSWSPIANTGIYVMDVAQPESVHSVTQSMYTDTAPAWSPDGREIAFMSDRDGNSEIYLMNPDGSDLRPITHNPARETMPAWSPDSQWIVFVSSQAGNYDLFMMRRDGMDIRQLTSDLADDAHPSWRP